MNLFPVFIPFSMFSDEAQSHYREVPWWEIFMEQELIFGLDLGWLALMKKKTISADYEQLLRPVFVVKKRIKTL